MKQQFIISKLMFRLLPVQILLAVVSAIYGLVFSYFASISYIVASSIINLIF